MTQSGCNFREGWMLTILRSEVSPENPIYEQSIKRLCLQTGLAMDDVHLVLGLLASQGLIEPIGTYGWKVNFEEAGEADTRL